MGLDFKTFLPWNFQVFRKQLAKLQFKVELPRRRPSTIIWMQLEGKLIDKNSDICIYLLKNVLFLNLVPIAIFFKIRNKGPNSGLLFGQGHHLNSTYTTVIPGPTTSDNYLDCNLKGFQYLYCNPISNWL